MKNGPIDKILWIQLGLYINKNIIIQIYSAIKANFNNQNCLVIYEARHSCCYCQNAEQVIRNAQDRHIGAEFLQ